MAGIETDIRRVFINYRNQWPGIGKTFLTYSASYDQYIEDLHGGVGIRLMNDIQGDGTFREFSISGDYSYHLKVNRNLQINAGFEAGFNQRSIHTGDFIFEDMINPSTGQVMSSSSESYSGSYRAFPDFTVGFSSFYKSFFGGIAMAHLLKPMTSESNNDNTAIPRRLTAFAGALFPIYERRLGKEVLQLSPNVIFQQQKSFSQINYGIETYLENQFIAGFWIRQNLGIKINSLIFSAGYVSESFRLRYSYDRHLSSPSVNLPALGAHELSVVLSLRNVKKIRHKAIKCPKI